MLSRKTLPLALVAVAIAGSALGAAYWMSRPKSMEIDFRDPTQVAMGKEIYSQACASCHGANLEGQLNWQERKVDGKLPAPPHDASGHTWHHSDIDLFNIVKDGVQVFAGADYKTDMPAFHDTLTDEQIRAAISYIKSTWPEKQQTYQRQVSEQGARVKDSQ